jgi:predicted DNA-binding transcriptional regulator YafY
MTRKQAEALAAGNRAAGRAHRARMLGGIEDYLFIGGDRMSQRQAADRLGVTMRTICRYRAYLRGLGAR